MAEVISVRFRDGAKEYDFNPRGLQIEPGQHVVVETHQGMEYVKCTRGNHEAPERGCPLRNVVRVATDNDDRAAAYNRRREKEAFGICEKKIAEHGLEMKLVRVECSFEGNKIIFFFTAEGRVDFRSLVRDLAGVFRTRIELRQIGVRDEAKMLGGMGVCGQALCCTRFLNEFIPVSIKMAKTQNLPLNPSKISGCCGRLLCCLKYEQSTYEDAQKRLPRAESFVDTPDGLGNVSGVDVLREQVQVRLDSAPDAPRRYRLSEVRVLRSGRGSRDGIEIPQERPPRYVPPVPDGEEEPENERLPAVSAGSGKRQQDRQTDRPQGERRGGGERRRSRDSSRERQAAGRAGQAEKIPVRSVSSATRDKKAAADRAAADGANPSGRNRRRPRKRG